MNGILGGGIGIFVALFLLALAVLWFLLPFAIFGTKDKLDELIIESRKTNKQLIVLIETLRETSNVNNKNKKWEIAQKYTREVKSGLEFIYSQIKENSRSRSAAKSALKEVFFELGISAINKALLENIVEIVHTHEREREREAEKALEKIKAESQQFGSEEDLIEKLYDAVGKSQLEQVSKILSYNLISSQCMSMHKNALLEITRKRGDKALERLLIHA